MEKPTIKTNSEDYIVYSPASFDDLSKREFKQRYKEGYVPYYFDREDYALTEVKLDDSFNPLNKNDKRFRNNTKNPYSHIFFLKGDGVAIIEKQTRLLGNILRADDEKKELLLKYTASLVDELSKREDS